MSRISHAVACGRPWIALVAAVAGVTQPAFAADQFEDVRQFIRAELVQQSLPSVAVAVALEGRIVWEQGFGWADKERRIPADEHTSYSLASISKPITATGLMTLVQAGRIELDKPVNDYLGRAKLVARVGEARNATVRRVAQHLSGLPGHAQFFYSDEPFPRPSMDETILRYGNLVTAPGERHEYSNLGYGVLDYIIERVSGTSYAEFMRREVFLPLGLNRTSVDIDPALRNYTAVRYGKDGLAIPFYTFDHPGASAVFSSAHDLVRFGMFHLKERLPDQKEILRDDLLDEMHSIAAADAPRQKYAIGFATASRHGYRVVSHSGGMGGVATQMLLFPERRLAVVVLSNASSYLPFQVANRVAAKYLKGWPFEEQQRQQDPPAFAAPAELSGVWRGRLVTYANEQPVELRFLPDGSVRAKFGQQLPTLVSDGSFQNNVFTGQLSVRIGTPDTDRYDYTVWLSLNYRGESLNGAACALGGKSPRVRNELSHWIDLRRVQP